MKKKLIFLYPYARDKTIGGVSSAQRPAEKWFIDNGYDVLSENYIGLDDKWFEDRYEEGYRSVVCCNRDFNLFNTLHNAGFYIYLIGHGCCWITFYNDPLDSGFQLEGIRKFMEYNRYKIVDYIPLTENDAKLYDYLFQEKKEVGINPPIPEPITVDRSKHVEGRFTVGMIGRVAPEKNHEDFLKMAKDRTDWTWLYTDAFDPNYPDYYKHITAKLKQPNIYAVDPKQIDFFWNRVDAIVLPSIHEASPVVFFEALRRGIPVVAYDNITPDYEWFCGDENMNAIVKVPQTFYHDAINALWDIKDCVEGNPDFYEDNFKAFNAVVQRYYNCHRTWMQIIDEKERRRYE